MKAAVYRGAAGLGAEDWPKPANATRFYKRT